VVVTVEERALLGIDQARARAVGFELGGGHRDRDLRVVEVHIVGSDNALVGHDVLDERLEGIGWAAAGCAAAADLFTADAEVELVLGGPFVGAAEPAFLGCGVGERAEDAGGGGVVGAVDDESGVGDGSFGHASLLGFLR